MTAQKVIRMGFPIPGKDADINTCCAVRPMLSALVMPVIAEPNVPCRDTHSEYRLTGTTVNRLTAIKPLI